MWTAAASREAVSYGRPAWPCRATARRTWVPAARRAVARCWGRGLGPGRGGASGLNRQPSCSTAAGCARSAAPTSVDVSRRRSPPFFGVRPRPRRRRRAPCRPGGEGGGCGAGDPRGEGGPRGEVGDHAAGDGGDADADEMSHHEEGEWGAGAGEGDEGGEDDEDGGDDDDDDEEGCALAAPPWIR